MRTDVRIGIAVGLFLAIVATVYFVVAGWDKPGQVTEIAEAPGPEEPPRVRIEGPPDAEPISAVPTPPPERIPEDEPSMTPLPIRLVEPRFEGELTGDPTRTEGADDPDATGDPDRTITPAIPSVTPWALRPDAIEITSTTAPGAENFYSDVERTYIVQYGDHGFWTVAARMYGDGKYFGVITEANPDVDSNSLRPGQKLLVPPLPEKHRRKAVEPTPRADFLRGQRVYVVRKGDAGFWGVSVKVFGHGKYYKEIAKANPGVDSENLKPGQKLLIPPKPIASDRPDTGDAGIGVAPLRDGYRTYVVRRGDAGFWDVAVKMYGNGKHFGLVARANPGVDSRRLQPGQKLRVPPLTEARRLTSAATAPIIEERSDEISPPGTDRRPIFD